MVQENFRVMVPSHEGDVLDGGQWKHKIRYITWTTETSMEAARGVAISIGTPISGPCKGFPAFALSESEYLENRYTELHYAAHTQFTW